MSPRGSPSCRHFGTCGGCTAQHWNEAAYLEWKTGRLIAALRRAGFDDPAVAPIVRGAPGTRRRMDLAVRRVLGAWSSACTARAAMRSST